MCRLLALHPCSVLGSRVDDSFKHTHSKGRAAGGTSSVGHSLAPTPPGFGWRGNCVCKHHRWKEPLRRNVYTHTHTPKVNACTMQGIWAQTTGRKSEVQWAKCSSLGDSKQNHIPPQRFLQQPENPSWYSCQSTGRISNRWLLSRFPSQTHNPELKLHNFKI